MSGYAETAQKSAVPKTAVCNNQLCAINETL